MKRSHATRRRVIGGMLVVGLLASILLVELAQTSVAATSQGCTVSATKPDVNGAATQVTGHGSVLCDAYHVLSLTVYLQVYAGGKWSNTAKKSDSSRRGTGLSLDVTADCGRFPHDYRSKSVATIDGTTVTETSNLTASC